MAKKVLPMKDKGKPVAAKATKAEKPDRKSRFIGTTTGLGVMAYQNQSLLQNRKRHLSDEELAVEWRKEFPNAIATYTAETVSGVRGLFNKGKHGNDVPDEPLRAYDAEGNELPLWGEKTREREAAKAERAEAKAAEAKAAKPAPKPTVVKRVKRSA